MSTAVVARPPSEILLWAEPVDPVSLAKRERDRRAAILKALNEAAATVKNAFAAIGRAAYRASLIIGEWIARMWRTLRSRRKTRASRRTETPARSAMHAAYRQRSRRRKR